MRTPPVAPVHRYDRFCANLRLGRLSAATIVEIRAYERTATGRTLLERQQVTVQLVDDLGMALSTLVNCAAHDVYYLHRGLRDACMPQANRLWTRQRAADGRTICEQRF
jgi:hypothetical protein